MVNRLYSGKLVSSFSDSIFDKPINLMGLETARSVIAEIPIPPTMKPASIAPSFRAAVVSVKLK